MDPLRRALLFSPSLLLASCGGGLGDPFNVDDPRVRFVHAAPDAGRLTFYRDAGPQSDANNVAYGYASGYYDVGGGQSLWSVRSADGSATYGSVGFDPNHGNRYTVIALPGSPVGLLSIRDPYDKFVLSAAARLRVVNAANTFGDVDVYLTSGGGSLSGVVPLVSSLRFGASRPRSEDNSIEVGGGDYRLRVTYADTRDEIFSKDITIRSDRDWLLIVAPDPASPGRVMVLVAKAEDGNGPMTVWASD